MSHTQDTQQRIDQIVKSNDVVLFMKGTAQFPMCGFSGRAIQVLKACGVNKPATVNVLEDEEIRQGIKEYSNWPTIPQLYVKGEFIGGSDIMMEMYQSGELQQVLGAPAAILVSLIMVPETQLQHTKGELIDPEPVATGTMDAVVKGTTAGLELLLNICAMLIVLVALVHLANAILGLLPDVGAQPHDPPFPAATGVLTPQPQHVVHPQVERIGHLTQDRPRRSPP